MDDKEKDQGATETDSGTTKSTLGGAVAGAVAGTALGVPVVGTVIGALSGAALGAAVGCPAHFCLIAAVWRDTVVAGRGNPGHQQTHNRTEQNKPHLGISFQCAARGGDHTR